MRKTKKTIKFRRRREGKTDYKKRLALIKSKALRLVIRKTNTKIMAQLVEYQTPGDKVLVAIDSNSLKKYGWDKNTGNLSAAYLTGYLLGKKAQKKNIKRAILDMGLIRPVKGSKIFACLKGVVDSGLDISHNPKVFPTQEQIEGLKKDIKETFKKVKTKVEQE